MKKILLGSRTEKKIYTLVDDRDFEMLSKNSWSLNQDGYAVGAIRVEGKFRHVFLHHSILPKKEQLEVDHINQIKLDNRRENLRYVTKSDNLANQISKLNRNVYPRGLGKWQVAVRKNKKLLFFGTFSSIELARKKAILVRAELFPNVFR